MHVAAPLIGKIVELHPAHLLESSMVKGDTTGMLSVMKTETDGVPRMGREKVLM